MKGKWLYLDTSTFLKLYVKEKDSERARNLVKQSFILSSAILPVESFSALSRKKQNGDISNKIFDKLAGRIKSDLAAIEIIMPGDDVLKRTENVVLNSTARTLDAIHIASALVFEDMSGIRLTFVTSDRKQHKIAVSQGLDTVFAG